MLPHGNTKLTSEDIAKVNKAMEACDGNRKAAAEVLGMPYQKLVETVVKVPALYARWGNDKAVLGGEVMVNPVTTINRVPPTPTGLSASERRAAALVVQEKRMKKSLSRLGFQKAEIEMISSVEEFAGKHFEQTLSIMHGSLLKSAMRLMLLATRIEKDYLQDEGLDEKDRKWWWDQYFRILETLRDFNDQTNKAALTKAMIDIKRKETNSLGKPGFSSTPLVNINVGQNQDRPERKVAGWTPPPLPPSKG